MHVQLYTGIRHIAGFDDMSCVKLLVHAGPYRITVHFHFRINWLIFFRKHKMFTEFIDHCKFIASFVYVLFTDMLMHLVYLLLSQLTCLMIG